MHKQRQPPAAFGTTTVLLTLWLRPSAAAGLLWQQEWQLWRQQQ